MELKDRIRRAREAAGWRQEDLAAKVGVDVKTVRNWEAGRVPRRSIGAIERVLGIDLTSPPEAVRGSRAPALDQASEVQILTELINRIAERDQRIRELTEELANTEERDRHQPVRGLQREPGDGPGV